MINFLLSVLSAIPWKHHSFIACGIVYSCYTLVNNTGNELVIFPGIALKTGNKRLVLNYSQLLLGAFPAIYTYKIRVHLSSQKQVLYLYS